VEVNCRNIRDYANNKHNRVDDKPYGGGTGMVIQAEPVYLCVTDIIGGVVGASCPTIVYMSPQGQTLNQELVRELAAKSHLILLCGHYEGIDSRVLEAFADEFDFMEVSVGDFVVTGGELPALLLADAVIRLQEGVLPDESAYTCDSHWDGLLEHPLYTRPEVWRGRTVPEVLLSGHHAQIEVWKSEQSRAVTGVKRPDLVKLHKES
jgi:tRNA (guanine37-N1)-methyltransferase